MTRIRYTMPARLETEPCAQRAVARLVEEDVHRRVFVDGVDSDAEDLVRRRLAQWPDDFHCDLQVVYTPHFTGTDARDSNPRDAVKATVEAMGLSPHPAVCRWPFCLVDLDDANNTEGGCDVA